MKGKERLMVHASPFRMMWSLVLLFLVTTGGVSAQIFSEAHGDETRDGSGGLGACQLICGKMVDEGDKLDACLYGCKGFERGIISDNLDHGSSNLDDGYDIPDYDSDSQDSPRLVCNYGCAQQFDSSPVEDKACRKGCNEIHRLTKNKSPETVEDMETTKGIEDIFGMNSSLPFSGLNRSLGLKEQSSENLSFAILGEVLRKAEVSGSVKPEQTPQYLGTKSESVENKTMTIDIDGTLGNTSASLKTVTAAEKGKQKILGEREVEGKENLTFGLTGTIQRRGTEAVKTKKFLGKGKDLGEVKPTGEGDKAKIVRKPREIEKTVPGKEKKEAAKTVPGKERETEPKKVKEKIVRKPREIEKTVLGKEKKEAAKTVPGKERETEPKKVKAKILRKPREIEKTVPGKEKKEAAKTVPGKERETEPKKVVTKEKQVTVNETKVTVKGKKDEAKKKVPE
ncbi:hypothetical protein Hamer_G005026, partial [Homarus americanus]